MGVDCYCNFRSEPGSIPVPAADNSINSHKNIKKNNSNQNDQEVLNNLSTYNKNEQRLNKNDNSVIKINNENNNNKIIKNLNNSEFEKIIKEHSKEILEEKFSLLIKGKIKEIETELGEINQNKKKEYISQNNQNIIYKSPLYFSESKSTYCGTWCKNTLQKEGWGIIIDENGNKYEGGWKSDKMDGYGRIISINGDYYEGEMHKGKMEGNGIFYSSQNMMLYKGSFKSNFFEGKGEQIFQNFGNQKVVYEGQFKRGKREGKGKMTFSDGNYYEGDFKDDKYDGEGYFKFKDGREYNGSWKNNEMNGKGVFIWDNDKKYEGEYKDSRREGFGIYYFGNNNYYKGKWINNAPHGEGKLQIDGKNVNGLFRFGKLIKTTNLTSQKLSSNKMNIDNWANYSRQKSKKVKNNLEE